VSHTSTENDQTSKEAQDRAKSSIGSAVVQVFLNKSGLGTALVKVCSTHYNMVMADITGLSPVLCLVGECTIPSGRGSPPPTSYLQVSVLLQSTKLAIDLK
jgi:hypothetical protein